MWLVTYANKFNWCERGDSNPHGCPLDPKSSASANSATLAHNLICCGHMIWPNNKKDPTLIILAGSPTRTSTIESGYLNGVSEGT